MTDLVALKTEPLTGAAIDVLWCLFKHGPTLDGEVPSKAGRSQLVDLGMADRHDGWNWLTREGVEAAIAFGYDRKKGC